MSVKKVTWDKAIGSINIVLVYLDLHSPDPPVVDISVPEGLISDQDSKSYYYLGLVLSLKDDIKKGIECFERALSLDPTFVSAYFSKGDLLLNAGDIGGAIRTFNQALRYCTENKQKGLVYGKIGYSFYLSKIYAKAVECFNKASNCDSSSPEWLNNLGCCYILSGNNLVGTNIIKQVVEFNPQNQIFRLNADYLAILDGDIEKLPDFVMKYISPINDQKQRQKILREVIYNYEIQNKDQDCNFNYFGVCYILIGCVDIGFKYFEKIKLKNINVQNDIKFQVLTIVLEYIKEEKSIFSKYNFPAIITSICGPEFVLNSYKFENPDDLPIQTLIAYSECLHNPSYENLRKLAEIFMSFSIEIKMTLKTDPLFQRSFSDVSDWEQSADMQFRIIKKNIIQILKASERGYERKSIFDPVIKKYENILIYSPKNTRIMEKLADVYTYMGQPGRERAKKLYEEILKLDPNNANVKKNLQLLCHNPEFADFKSGKNQKTSVKQKRNKRK